MSDQKIIDAVNKQLKDHGVEMRRRGRGYSLSNGPELKVIRLHEFESLTVEQIVEMGKNLPMRAKRPLTHFLFIRDEIRTSYEIVRELPHTLDDDPTVFTWTDEHDNVLGYTYAGESNPNRYVVELLDKFVVTIPSLALSAEGATMMEANDNLYIGVPHDSALHGKIASSTKNFYTVAAVVPASYVLTGNRLGKENSELGEKSVRFLLRMGISLPKKRALTKSYSVETKEIGAGWNGDSGFRFRLVCSDGRKTDWAEYTRVCFLDDMGAMTPYYHGGSDIVILPLHEILPHIAIGECVAPVEGGESVESDGADDGVTMPAPKED